MGFRIIVTVVSLAVLGGAGYMSYFGVGSVSRDLAVQSVRTGSGGGTVFVGGGRIK